MGLMAGQTPFAQRFVFEYEGPALHGMTFETSIVLARQLRAAALDCVPLMRIMAIRAAHFALQHGMVMRQRKLGADL